MRFLIALCLLLLTGCSGTLPQTQHYLLRSDSVNQFSGQDAGATVAIGQLTVATYIDRLGLVLETQDGAVSTARYHEWAEPLRESLRSFLANEIAASTAAPVRFRARLVRGHRTDATVINIHIDQLHGRPDGSAILEAYWVIENPADSAVIAEHQFSDSQTLTADGYGALVQAEKMLLQRLAARIAASL